MATIVKQHLSESDDGEPVAVGTSSAAVHQTQAGDGDNNHDEIWLWATNEEAAARVLTIGWGDAATTTSHKIIVTIPPQQGLMQIVPGLVLQNGHDVYAMANATGVNLLGFVNKMTA